MPDINRFAGFTSPSRLLRDPFLSREDKLSGLSTWKGMARRLSRDTDDETYARLMYELNRALSRLMEPS